MGAESRRIVCQATADVKGDSRWVIRHGEQRSTSKAAEQGCPPHGGRGIDGAFQPLSTTIVQTIAEFADGYRVRIWGTVRCERADGKAAKC